MTHRPIAVLELRSVRGTGGGPEKTILVGAARADRSRFSITVCYIRDLRDDVFAIDQRAEEAPIDYIEARERHSFDRSIWRTLKGIVHDRRIDIVHGHDYKTDLLAYFLARRTGVLALSTAHGWTGQSRREKFVYYPVHKRLLTRFGRVIAVSSEIKAELVKLGATPSHISVLLNGIDAAAFTRVASRRNPVRLALGYGRDHLVIGAVGRLERQKRFDLLLTSFARIASEYPQARLAIVGDGSLRPALEMQATVLGIADRCRFPGHRTDIADVHHAFDLFVQSSEYEGTPNAVLEAMAMESPVVATNAGGTAELMPSGHGWLVPIRDEGALTAAMSAALANPETARKMAAAARARVLTDLSFDARTRRLEAIYEEMVRGRGGLTTLQPSRVSNA
jgi:glycosyltransferase involved in cell wall biosynthesis